MVAVGYGVIVTVRTVGVEEEFLLVDVATGLPAAAADSVAAWATAMGQGGTIDRELTLQQVETATGITTDLAGLRAELVQRVGVLPRRPLRRGPCCWPRVPAQSRFRSPPLSRPGTTG